MADSDLPQLDAAEQRVLGALLEKQRTVPGSYPLSLNALRTACNQSSSRDPVVDYDDQTVLATVAALKARELLRFVWAGAGSRTVKYHQLLDVAVELSAPERALLTVLLLRGPQAPGELKTRTERLHSFADRHEVEDCLTQMAQRPTPLVTQLPRRSGQQDLFAPVPQPAGAAEAVPAVDREQVLRFGARARDEKVRAGYDAVAADYAQASADDLDLRAFDRWALERVVEFAEDHPVADVGCGPGHLSAFLALLGGQVTGFDLSPAMVAQAGQRYPELTFEVADLTRLLRPRTAAGWGGVVAWFSLGHLAASELPAAVAALARVLCEGGCLGIAVHGGAEVLPTTTVLGVQVEAELVLHDLADLLAAVEEAGLVDVEWYRRGPQPGETHEQIYVLARRPS
jgi:uncharacterized protein YceH (UPF0502 family)/SAM-dependent methyltransferase